MASAVATLLERQFSTIAGIDEMTSVSSLGHDAHHHTVRARPRHRRRGPGRAVRDRLRGAPAARDHAGAAVVPQGEPGGFRRSYYLALTSDAFPLSAVDEYAETNLAQRIST